MLCQVLTHEHHQLASFSGCTGTRNLSDNISDLKAQIAANNKGIRLVCDLIDEYSLSVVQAYMAHIQSTAETSVRDMLRHFAKVVKRDTGATTLHALDHMDDGTLIRLRIDIEPEKVDPNQCIN